MSLQDSGHTVVNETFPPWPINFQFDPNLSEGKSSIQGLRYVLRYVPVIELDGRGYHLISDLETHCSLHSSVLLAFTHILSLLPLAAAS